MGVWALSRAAKVYIVVGAPGSLMIHFERCANCTGVPGKSLGKLSLFNKILAVGLVSRLSALMLMSELWCQLQSKAVFSHRPADQLYIRGH